MTEESPLAFSCANETLIGVVHAGAKNADIGVVIVVGGPQYRVGSHRQFVITARNLAAAGLPVLRFDYRGMGDSEGRPRKFNEVGDDIRAAIDCLVAKQPTIKAIALYGLCDAASAVLMYASSDQRVTRIILLNPWVYTVQGEARSYLRYYYLQRIFQRSFWSKVFHGQFSAAKSLQGAIQSIRDALTDGSPSDDTTSAADSSFILRMRMGLEEFGGSVLLILSGRDLTARQFEILSEEDRLWKNALSRPNVTTVKFAEADHTMSTREHLNAANGTCIRWLID